MIGMHSHKISPFAARVRIALAHKGVDWDDLGLPDAAAPDHGLKTPGYLAINPIGKIPVLVIEDGTPIAESETILDYIEDAYPQNPLRPANPLARAKMRNVIRTLDTYVSPALFRLFKQLDPSTAVEAIRTAEFAALEDGLRLVGHFVDDAPYATGGAFTLADCVLFPTLHLCRGVARFNGTDDVLAKAAPGLAGYYAKARLHPLLGAEEAGMDEAAKSYS